MPLRAASVHPHACGERFRIVRGCVGTIGSSPRLWGTDRVRIYSCLRLRFIPTPVGNGQQACATFATLIGSSPRLWGTDSIRNVPARSGRFIPTPVGNGVPVSRESSGWPVHPHACGERGGSAGCEGLNGGSSPRLWGTGFRRCLPGTCSRFIPTPVGNGAKLMILVMVSSVHPHACGERVNLCSINQMLFGSSPRLWGTA